MSDQPDRDSRDVDLSAIGDTFKQLIGHMRGGIPVWEDFVARGVRFQKQMEQTILAFNSFLEGFSRIAELATHSKGSTREISSGLTNLVMWHKGQELKLREMNQAFMGKLLAPLQGKIEEWKKMTTYLDREHEKEVQKAAKEIKEVAKTTVKVSKNLESKLKKDKSWEKCSVLQQQLEQCQQETERRVRETEERERKNLSRVLVEERTWFCGFVNAFSWVLDIEVGMLGDLEQLQAILKDLGPAVARPNQLPQTMQEFVETWVIPSSPVPRKRVSPHIPPSSHEITPPAAPPVPTLPPPPPGPPGPIPPPPNFHLPPPPPTFNPPPPTSTSLNPSFIAPMDPYNGYAPVGAMRPVPDEQFDPVALAMSISPSQASLMSNSSHQSTESSRSLSPPVGPTRSPAQPRAQLAAPQEDEPSSLQLEIMSRLRQRAQSLEGAQGPPESLPTISRTASLVVKPTSSSSMAVKPLTASPLLGGRRPPPVALKPARNSAGAEILTANGRQSPQLGYAHPHHSATLPPANGRQSPQLGYANPHHLLNPATLPPANERQSPQLGYAHPHHPTSLPPANGRQSPQLGYAHPHHPTSLTSLPPANGRQSPQLGYAHPHYSATLPPANRRQSPQLGYAHPHHILNPTSLTSRQDSSSDSEEEESAFAKALKQKKLRKAAQVSDRSGPNIGR